jgi:hypothetical protein
VTGVLNAVWLKKPHISYLAFILLDMSLGTALSTGSRILSPVAKLVLLFMMEFFSFSLFF